MGREGSRCMSAPGQSPACAIELADQYNPRSRLDHSYVASLPLAPCGGAGNGRTHTDACVTDRAYTTRGVARVRHDERRWCRRSSTSIPCAARDTRRPASPVASDRPCVCSSQAETAPSAPDQSAMQPVVPSHSRHYRYHPRSTRAEGGDILLVARDRPADPAAHGAGGILNPLNSTCQMRGGIVSGIVNGPGVAL